MTKLGPVHLLLVANLPCLEDLVFQALVVQTNLVVVLCPAIRAVALYLWPADLAGQSGLLQIAQP